ncbi:MalY/PatB family protein [Microbacterium sp. A84]|uniref:MalY/PatB family protein n=1 Tax=Microbacterium sp. A84 TaxID=3450715 RepID=UPI003F41F6DD
MVTATIDVRASDWVTRKWDQPEGIIGAHIAESDFGTSPAIGRALHRAVDAGFLTYLPERLAAQAESACAGFQDRRYGWSVDPASVRLVPDVMTGITLAIAILTPEDSSVVVPTPAYPYFLTAPAQVRRRVVTAPMNRAPDGRWSLGLEAIRVALAAGARTIVLCNPHNPLGQIHSDAELDALLLLAEEFDALIVSDEIHAPISFGPRHVPFAHRSPAAAKRTVTVTAASKGWNVPGLKSAQVILSGEAHASTWTRLDPVPRQSGSILGAIAAVEAYRHSDDWLDGLLVRLRRHRDHLADRLPRVIDGARMRTPDATYLAWIDVRSMTGALDSAVGWRDAGVAVLDGRQCGPGGEGHVRFNFATSLEMIDTALNRIAERRALGPAHY